MRLIVSVPPDSTGGTTYPVTVKITSIDPDAQSSNNETTVNVVVGYNLFLPVTQH